MFFENRNNECGDEGGIIKELGRNENNIRENINSRLIKELDFPSDEDEDSEDIDVFK